MKPTPSTASDKYAITRWRKGLPVEQVDDHVAAEEPLEIRVRGKSVSVTMRTPGGETEDAELAAGFLLTEGIIHQRQDIARIDTSTRDTQGNIINVFLAPHVELDYDKLTRHVFMSSSCGLCGKASIEAVHAHFAPLTNAMGVDAQIIAALPYQLRQAQVTFDETGGLHAAALFDETGHLIALREDVGRHNAVDKVLGLAFLNGLLPLDRHILQVSGRTSFEIVQKALAARIAIVSAVSAPTGLAVEFARDSCQTLIGFVRAGRMNIYSNPQRIRFNGA